MRENRPESTPRMVVGLGNPGGKYRKTRHNIGFLAIDGLAQAHKLVLKPGKFNALQWRGALAGQPVVLVKPMLYMNRSGIPVQRLSQFYKIEPREILVVHDDIDLAFGRLKIKKKGGSGGHNGIRSLMDAFGGGDFPRLRIGVGRPDHREAVTGHVLGAFSPTEQRNLADILSAVGDAIHTILTDGVAAGMNRFNGKTFGCCTQI